MPTDSSADPSPPAATMSSSSATSGSSSARSRRSQATSSESSEAGEFNMSSIRLRVGAPPPLPLPMATNFAHCHWISQELGDGVLEGETDAIVAAENVNQIVSIELVSRVRPELALPDEGQPTILIVAHWEDGCSLAWERVVRRVKQMADARRLKAPGLKHLDIAVEMIAEELTLPKYLSLVPADLLARGLERDWPVIRDKAFQILESHPATRNHTTTISLFRLGFSMDDGDNNNTVYISLDYTSNEAGWPPVARELQYLLDQYGYAELALHMEHNVLEQYPFELVPGQPNNPRRAEKRRLYNLVPTTPYNTAVNLGADIGPSRYLVTDDGKRVSPTIGTLGCWLEIKSDRFPDWTKVLLTNYHIIRAAYDGFTVAGSDGQYVARAPRANSALLKIDHRGVVPKTGAPKIENPTRLKHNVGVQNLRLILSNVSLTEGRSARQDKLDQMLDFFDQGKNELGTIYCASGFGRRTASNGRLDWALIMPLTKDRVGTNKLPSFEDWVQKYCADSAGQFPRAETSNATLGQPPPAGVRRLDHQQYIYKVGASTRLTVGQFNKMESSVKLRDDKHVGERMSTEYAFVHSLVADNGDERLADLGDSGSVVWDEEGRPVGLLFRGLSPQQTGRAMVAYVTPIEDVLADIKKFSAGRIHEIRISED